MPASFGKWYGYHLLESGQPTPLGGGYGCGLLITCYLYMKLHDY